MKMKTKTIIPVAIVALFVSLAFVPAISATEVNIGWIEEENAPVQHEKIELSDGEEGEYEKLIDVLTRFCTWLDDTKPFQDYTLSQDEIDTAKGYIDEFKLILKESTLLKTLTTEKLVDLLLSSGGQGNILKSCFVSIGYGRTFMPLWPYEWGFSGGTPFVKPLIFYHMPGYTGVIKYRPPLGAMGYDKTRRHLFIVQGLQGLWIDGGKLGVVKPFHFGIEFIIGRGRVFTFGPS